MNGFRVSKQQLIDVIECYRQRKYIEELTYIKDKLGGIKNVLDGLDVNPDQGIDATSLQARTEAFGDHAKEKPQRTPFCDLVWESLQDFML
tara:strand:+ start:80 stop:352 length:273 start_codon:yes stop_codon:yes gene_type:complete